MPLFVVTTYTPGWFERNERTTTTREYFEPIEDEL